MARLYKGNAEPNKKDAANAASFLPTHPNKQQSRAALALALASARRRRTTARQRGASTSNPIGQLTPVPPMPQ